MACIYDLGIHRDEVLIPFLKYWKIFELEGLDAEGEQAREKLATFMDGLDKKAARFEDKREMIKARQASQEA